MVGAVLLARLVLPWDKPRQAGASRLRKVESVYALLPEMVEPPSGLAFVLNDAGQRFKSQSATVSTSHAGCS